jgi:hypothetical protein
VPLCDVGHSGEPGIGAIEQYAELGPLHRGRSLPGGWEAADLMVHEPRGGDAGERRALRGGSDAPVNAGSVGFRRPLPALTAHIAVNAGRAIGTPRLPALTGAAAGPASSMPAVRERLRH